ncbi:MAG: DUF4411 family protein [Bacteroidales bacterium]|nr:DUF4411 family protein [Bacteroidales bacterium]
MYLLDANSFIQSQNVYYPIDVFPSVWDTFEALALKGEIGILENVRSEIIRDNDQSAHWLKRKFPKSAIFDVDQQTMNAYKIIQNDVADSKRYKTTALSVFADSSRADAYICAYAMSHLGVTVVTYEVSNGDKFDPKNPFKQVKIPDVCKLENIDILEGHPSIANMFKRLNILL